LTRKFLVGILREDIIPDDSEMVKRTSGNRQKSGGIGRLDALDPRTNNGRLFSKPNKKTTLVKELDREPQDRRKRGRQNKRWNSLIWKKGKGSREQKGHQWLG